MFPRHEMLDLVVVDGRARGIIARDLVTGEIKRFAADAVVLATGGYCAGVLPVDQRGQLQRHGRSGAATGAAPSSPTPASRRSTRRPSRRPGDYQSKLTLMSEILRNDGRVWVPKKPGDKRRPDEIPEDERDYYLERRYPAFGNLVPRDIAARAAKVGMRRRQGRRHHRLRGVPRLRRRHRAARPRRGGRSLRQPLRHVRGDHRRQTPTRRP